MIIPRSFSKHQEKLPTNWIKTIKFDADEIFIKSIFDIKNKIQNNDNKHSEFHTILKKKLLYIFEKCFM